MQNTRGQMYHVLMQLANKLNNAVKGHRGPLDIYVQVNTSGEESKFGVEPQDCASLAEHVHKECDVLRFAGLMTIGQQDYTSRPEDFQVLPANPCMRHAFSRPPRCLPLPATMTAPALVMLLPLPLPLLLLLPLLLPLPCCYPYPVPALLLLLPLPLALPPCYPGPGR